MPPRLDDRRPWTARLLLFRPLSHRSVNLVLQIVASQVQTPSIPAAHDRRKALLHAHHNANRGEVPFQRLRQRLLQDVNNGYLILVERWPAADDLWSSHNANLSCNANLASASLFFMRSQRASASGGTSTSRGF